MSPITALQWCYINAELPGLAFSLSDRRDPKPTRPVYPRNATNLRFTHFIADD
ncbi:hypothetical protein [Phormidium sp. CCY1219]|uniref:hypothetical protein n=1 Tax=Phormidium sp. CCY1219 TaxID=2886104 RepID=UPI002D1E90F7|nr:hypothetical protein [Phormidium sp. CCY1219]MEB3827954.1 hypothetical protein [Phormidium sp. CCY1219]